MSKICLIEFSIQKIELTQAEFDLILELRQINKSIAVVAVKNQYSLELDYPRLDITF